MLRKMKPVMHNDALSIATPEAVSSSLQLIDWVLSIKSHSTLQLIVLVKIQLYLTHAVGMGRGQIDKSEN